MPTSAVYPLLRPELRDAVERGHAALAAAMRGNVRHVTPGTVIVQQDEPHDLTYHVESGWFARSRQLVDGERQLIVVFLPNDIFGVKSMLLDVQPDSIVALTEGKVSSIDRRAVQDLAARNPDVALHLMFQLGEDERRLHNWTIALGRPALERIGLMLLDFHGRLHRLGLLEGHSYRLPMTQQDIGDRTGLSYVHVNRTFRALRERGVATIDRGTVHVTDLAKLREIAFPLLDVFEINEKGFGSEAVH